MRGGYGLTEDEADETGDVNRRKANADSGVNKYPENL